MIVESFFFRVLGVGDSKRGLSSFWVFVILKVQSVQKADFRA